MANLVIKEWSAAGQAVDHEGNCVRIVGRASGVISWFLAILRVDPTTSMTVSPKRVQFSSASLSGTQSRIVPIKNVCSTYYGYHKPWKSAVFVFLFFGFFLNAPAIIAMFLSSGPAVVNLFYGIGILMAMLYSLVYYYFNRSVAFGFIEGSGVSVSIKFKPSFIEGIQIDEGQAKYICEVVQYLIEHTKR